MQARVMRRRRRRPASVLGGCSSCGSSISAKRCLTLAEFHAQPLQGMELCSACFLSSLGRSARRVLRLSQAAHRELRRLQPHQERSGRVACVPGTGGAVPCCFGCMFWSPRVTRAAARCIKPQAAEGSGDRSGMATERHPATFPRRNAPSSFPRIHTQRTSDTLLPNSSADRDNCIRTASNSAARPKLRATSQHLQCAIVSDAAINDAVNARFDLKKGRLAS